MEWIIIIAVVIVLLLALIGAKGETDYKYRINGPLFSPAERSFYGVIESAVSDDYRVLGKVRIADILTPAKGMGRKHWQIAFNKISAKHFDYVLCRKDTLDVVAVVELDDKSHKKASSKKRDHLIQKACESATLTLVRFPAKANYSVSEVKEVIENSIHSTEQ